MNPSAIDDHVSGVLSRWCTFAATWRPPGDLGPRLCSCRVENSLLEAVDRDAWPHDVMHELAEALEAALVQVAAAHAEAHHALGTDAATRRAREEVRAVVARQADILVDVLEQCVDPRLSEYVEAEAARSYPAVEGAR